MFARAAFRKAPTKVSETPEHLPGQWTLPGFGPMTRVSTSIGDMHAQVLRERDELRCEMGENESVVSVDRINLDEDFMAGMPDSQPILIHAGALGHGLPKVDVLVSPEQKIGFGIQRCETGFRPARDFLGQRGVVRKTEPLFTYTRFRCDREVAVRMEGLWALVEG